MSAYRKPDRTRRCMPAFSFPRSRFSLSAIVTRRIFQGASYKPTESRLPANSERKQMDWNESSRRSFLMQFGAAGAVAFAAANAERSACRRPPAASRRQPEPTPADLKQAATRDAAHAVVARGQVRHVHPLGSLQRHRAARVGQGESKAFPFSQYELLAKHFHPKPERRARLGAPGQDAPGRSTW